MDLKKWLLRYTRARFKAESLWREACEWRERVNSVSSMLIDGMPHGSQKLDSFESGIIKALDLEYEAQMQTKYAREVRAEIQDVLNLVEDLDEYKILTMKYLEDRTWSEISRELKLSRSWVYDLHNRALNKLSTKLDNSGQNRTKSDSTGQLKMV